MTKSWYQSKTIWTAILAGVLGVVQAFGYGVPEWAYAILGSFGLYSLRVGKSVIA